MAEITLVFWRDIPAQVIAGKGRGAVKKPLPERFEQAIDRCAMKIGARDADAYMAEWRKAPAVTLPGTDAEAVEAEAARLIAEYDAARLAALIATNGWEPPRP
ncbi:MAG: virulence factor [Rhodobacteraceae bacterium]|nr:virulence factor [Paracoccaceae bacterium]